MTNHQALTLAEIIVGALQPMCQRIEIAGSIRRGRPVVNDIDLVILAKPGQEEAIKARVQQRCRVVTVGDCAFISALPLPRGYPHHEQEIQIDIWFARPEQKDLLEMTPTNFGTLLLCRTGSKEHNIRLASRAQALGLHWQPHQGVVRDCRVIASATEADVFAALQLPVIPPGFREGDVDWAEFATKKPEVRIQKPGPAPEMSDAQRAKLLEQFRLKREQITALGVAQGRPVDVACEQVAAAAQEVAP